jgi:hypothetical protein
MQYAELGQEDRGIKTPKQTKIKIKRIESSIERRKL